jgi:hypothetical protein
MGSAKLRGEDMLYSVNLIETTRSTMNTLTQLFTVWLRDQKTGLGESDPRRRVVLLSPSRLTLGPLREINSNARDCKGAEICPAYRYSHDDKF